MLLFQLIDLFGQTKQFNISKSAQSHTSCPGAFVSLMVYAVTIAYFIIRGEILIGHLDTSVNDVLQPRFVPSDEPLELIANA